jgi:DNA-binding GntR family transcriptional regulator
VRAVLEGAAARAAAGALRGNTRRLREEHEAIERAARAGDLDAYARHNMAFHRLIVEATGNEVMLRVWDSLLLEARTRICLTANQDTIDLGAAAASHGPIVDAFESGDGERAGRLLVEHAETFAGRHPVPGTAGTHGAESAHRPDPGASPPVR